MIKWCVLILTLSLSVPAFAGHFSENSHGKKVIRIEVGEDHKPKKSKKTNRRIDELEEENYQLRKRVRRLERAVLQLQDEVFQLSRQSKIREEKTYTCILKTRSRGTFMGEGHSTLKAKAKALKACEDKAGKFWCDEKDVQCD